MSASQDAAASEAGANSRSRLRNALEIAAIAIGLAVFCYGGFMGLHGYNAHLDATGHDYLSPETALDRMIPLSVSWIWPYLSYYPGCFLPVLLLTRMENLRAVALGFGVQFGIGFVFFYAVPMRMAQPEIVGATAAHDAMRWLYGIDNGYNIFPSLHTANAAMIACAFWRAKGPRWWGYGVAAWAAAIAISTVLVKQHYVLDVAAGLALAWLADRVAFRGLSHDGAVIAAAPATPTTAVAVPPNPPGGDA